MSPPEVYGSWAAADDETPWRKLLICTVVYLACCCVTSCFLKAWL